MASAAAAVFVSKSLPKEVSATERRAIRNAAGALIQLLVVLADHGWKPPQIRVAPTYWQSIPVRVGSAGTSGEKRQQAQPDATLFGWEGQTARWVPRIAVRVKFAHDPGSVNQLRALMRSSGSLNYAIVFSPRNPTTGLLWLTRDGGAHTGAFTDFPRPSDVMAPEALEALDYAEELAAAVELAAVPALTSYGQGRLQWRLGSAQDVANSLVGLLPSHSPWAEVVGPVYTTEQVRELMGAPSRQAIDDRVRRRTLFSLRTRDGHRVYPTFQFSGRMVVTGLSDVLKKVVGAVDGWTLASWLRAEQPELGGVSVMDCLKAEGRANESVLRVAMNAADRWVR